MPNQTSVRAVKARAPAPPSSAPGVLGRLRAHPRVEHVDDERAIGNSVIVTLRQGWTFSAMEDNRVDGADSPSAALAMVRSAKPFAGPFSD
jgi:hypothetical protein